MSKHAVWKVFQSLLALSFVGTVSWLLYGRLSGIDWGQVWQAIRGYQPGTLFAGLAFATSGYLAFAAYDLLSKQHLAHPVASLRVVAIALVAYALNLNLGAMVGGWAIRFRLYFRAGLDTITTTRIIGLGIIGNWSGYLLLAGYVFMFHPPELPSDWAISSQMIPAVGISLWFTLAAYLLLCLLRSGRPLRVSRFSLRIPSLGFTSLQIGAALLHWLSMALVLHEFLPSTVPFVSIIGVLLMASIAGAATHIPGGLGVIEGVFIAVLVDRVDTASLIGALFAFRATFYLTPLLLALLTYPVLELRSRKHRNPDRRDRLIKI